MKRSLFLYFKIRTWTCFHKIHHNASSLSHIHAFSRAQWFICFAASASALTCQSQCALTTAHTLHTLMQHFFSGYSQPDWGFTLTQASYSQLFKLALKEHLSHGEAKHYFLFDQNAFQKKLSHGSFEQLTLSHLINMCSNDKPEAFSFHTTKLTTQSHYRLHTQSL